MPTYTVKLIFENSTIVEKVCQAPNIWNAIMLTLVLWKRPDDTVIEINAYEETEA